MVNVQPFERSTLKDEPAPAAVTPSRSVFFWSDINDMMIYSQVYNSGKTVSSRFQGDKYLDSLLKRKSKMLHFQRSINIGITVYGYTKMNCGDKVSISLRKKSDSFSDRDFPMYDGEYIIVSIQHDFNFNTMIHNMDLSCSKITLTEGIPKSKYIEKP